MAGWFRSPSGVLAHADGDGQARAYTARGYKPVDEDTARAEIGDGIRLTVSRSDAKGTFDEESVQRAVREESPRTQAHRQRVEHEKRSAAARKGAETKRRRAEAEAKAEQHDGDDEAPDSEG